MIDKPLLGEDLLLDPVWADGLVGCWIMNEGDGNLVVDVARGYDLTSTGTWTLHEDGYCILLDDGVPQYLNRDESPLTGYPCTVVVWFNSDSITLSQCLFWIGDKDANNDYISLFATGGATGDPIRLFRAESSGFEYATTTTGYSANTWHCAAARVSHTNIDVFIDGGGKGNNGNVGASDFPSCDRVRIGYEGESSPAYPVSGMINCAFFWNRELSDTEVKTLYEDPFCMFQKHDLIYSVPMAGTVVPQIQWLRMNTIG